MVVDHVAILVPDAVETARDLRERYGLGSERGSYLPLAGTRMHTVWLEPPQYLEFHTIENREVAATTDSGRITLACESAGFGMLGWAVLVDDLEAVSERLGDRNLRLHDPAWRRHVAGVALGQRPTAPSVLYRLPEQRRQARQDAENVRARRAHLLTGRLLGVDDQRFGT